MLNVLVTGANGFIGRQLVRRLVQQDCNVTCLVRETSDCDSLQDVKCRLERGDVLQPTSLEEVFQRTQHDHVFHLAGLTKATHARALYDVNEIGTHNVLHALSELETPPVTIVVSTLAAAGPAYGSSPRLETGKPQPVSHYGKSKLAGEQAAQQFAERVPLTIVRPPIVFGPHDRDTFELFKTVAAYGLHPVPRRMSVSWIHVFDLCDALLAAAERGERVQPSATSSGIYFATSDRYVDYADLGRRVGQSLGRRAWAIPVPGAVVWTLAATSELLVRLHGRPGIFNFDKAREAMAGSWFCDGAKLTRDTGFQCKLSLEEALQHSATWYRDAGWI